MLGIPKGVPEFYYHEWMTHLPITIMEQRVNLEGQYLFCFVRNPYDKIISEYHWRMKNRMSLVYNEPTDLWLTFDEYMEVLLHRSPHIGHVQWNIKAHVMPQWTFIDNRVEVYRFEDFDAECMRLQERLDIDRPVPRVNVGSYDTEHTERTIEITNLLYEEDFKRFGYKII